MRWHAWIFQDPRQLKKKGAEKASYYVGWTDENGHRRSQSCGPGSMGQKNAERLKQQIEGELFAKLVLGMKATTTKRVKWGRFDQELSEDYFPQLKEEHGKLVRAALKKWVELVRPVFVESLNSKNVDIFISRRAAQESKKTGGLISEAQINKELRCLKLIFGKAKDWGYIEDFPNIRFQREPEKLKLYVLPEDFDRIYECCDSATQPQLQGIPTGDYWRALLLMAMMTGWRISELLALKWADVDMEKGTCITRHFDNKGRRDEVVALHDTLVDHLKLIRGFSENVFPWNRTDKALYRQLFLIQETAGLTKCGQKGGQRRTHEHSEECGCYAFHAFRRACATENADRLTEVALQRLMRHKSFNTTKRYINQAKQLKPLQGEIYVPSIASRKKVK